MKIKSEKKSNTKYNYNKQWKNKHQDVKYGIKKMKSLGEESKKFSSFKIWLSLSD